MFVVTVGNISSLRPIPVGTLPLPLLSLPAGHGGAEVVDAGSGPGHDRSSSVPSGHHGGAVGNIAESLGGQSRLLVDVGQSLDLLVDVGLGGDLLVDVGNDLRSSAGRGDKSENDLKVES